jgi:hypothetical protein
MVLGSRLTVSILGALQAFACFPYRQTYRPQSSGVVLHADGTPAPNERVIACSESRWIGLGRGCARKESTTTDFEGRFQFDMVREWEWCCMGEAPLPLSVFLACGRDGTMAGAILSESDSEEASKLRLVLGEPSDTVRTGSLHTELSKDDASLYCQQAEPKY